MAKASNEDLNMAMAIANVLEDIEKGYFPEMLGDGARSGIEWIDTDSREQYSRLISWLKGLLEQGSIFRVVFGMAVVSDPANECLDPDSEMIEHHPKRLQLQQQKDSLLEAVEIPW
jgi:hypothetical protein